MKLENDIMSLPDVRNSQEMVEKFIEENMKEMNYSWVDVSKFQYLSEPFIEKHSDKVHWLYISIYQTLSESFIEKHADKVDWDSISRYQTVSESFIEKYNDKLDYRIFGNVKYNIDI